MKNIILFIAILSSSFLMGQTEDSKAVEVEETTEVAKEDVTNINDTIELSFVHKDRNWRAKRALAFRTGSKTKIC